jgi:hypothetical protein
MLLRAIQSKVCRIHIRPEILAIWRLGLTGLGWRLLRDSIVDLWRADESFTLWFFEAVQTAQKTLKACKKHRNEAVSVRGDWGGALQSSMVAICIAFHLLALPFSVLSTP